MNQKRSMKNRQPYWIAAIFMLAPLGLGAKGCDRAVVGNEGECPEGPDQCETGGSAGTAGSSGSAGNSGAPSTGGTSTAGSAGNSGAPSTGGTSTAGSAGTGSSGTSSTTTCGGLLGEACAENEYCHYSPGAMCGAADQTGVCRVLPEACDGNLLPVCGCDDRTYGNACEAATAGVSISHEGECDATGVACGGFAGDTCSDTEYCEFPPEMMCGIADGSGTCRPRPEVCEDVYEPVCGCDSMTYANSCEAAGAGTGVFSMGPCETDPGFCGGIAGFTCAEGEFCNFPLETMCGQGDMAGSCDVIPETCPTVDEPVCGCDGQTYSNTCLANVAGTSVASVGECETDPGFCGGIAGFTCPEGEYCAYPIEAMCGAADQGGTCAWMPEVCTADVDPVCGCDGMTYSNACMAAGAGISVQADGACPTR